MIDSRCEKCGNKYEYVRVRGEDAPPFRYEAKCACDRAPEGAQLVIGTAGTVIGWTAPSGNRPRAHVGDTVTTTEGTYWTAGEDLEIGDFVTYLDGRVYRESEYRLPGARVTTIERNEAARDTPVASRIGDGRDELRQAADKARAEQFATDHANAEIACRAAYDAGVAATREAIAAAKYDAERSYAEWSVRDVEVPPWK